jgi:hypothetical protein
MNWVCFVCHEPIDVAKEPKGKLRLEGVTEGPKFKAWVWGPEPVHEPCRLDLVTPFDDDVDGERYQKTWQRIAP